MTQRQPYHWIERGAHQIGYKAEDQYGNYIQKAEGDWAADHFLMHDRYNPLILTWVAECRLRAYHGDKPSPEEQAILAMNTKPIT